MYYCQCPFQQGYTGERNSPSKYKNDPRAWCFKEEQGEEEDDYI